MSRPRSRRCSSSGILYTWNSTAIARWSARAPARLTRTGYLRESHFSSFLRYASMVSQIVGTASRSRYETRNSRINTRAVARVTLITFAPRKYPFGTIVGFVSFASNVVWYHPISFTR